MTPLELAEKLTNVRGERFYFLTGALQKLTPAELGLLERTIDSYARAKTMPVAQSIRPVLTYHFYPNEDQPQSYAYDLVRVDEPIDEFNTLAFVLLNSKGERVGRWYQSPYQGQLEDAALADHADLRYRLIATDAEGNEVHRQSFIRDSIGRHEAGAVAVALKDDERVTKIVIFSGDADGPDRSYNACFEKHVKEDSDGEIEWRSSTGHGPEPRKSDFRLLPQPLEHVE